MIAGNKALHYHRNTFGAVIRSARMLLIPSILLFWLLTACNGGTPPAPVTQSSEASGQVMALSADGGKMLEERCSVCHGTNKIKEKRKASIEWEQTVNRMITKGARLNEEEKNLVLDYLNKNFAP